MPGISDFTTQTFHPRVIVTKAANYTVLLTDELIQINGAYTMTLPVISTMQGTTTKKKTLKFTNIHATSDGTISAGTGNTIGGRASYVLKPNESIVIEAREIDTDWDIVSPIPTPKLLRHSFNAVATSNGTAAVDVFDSNGAPNNIVVTGAIAIATETATGNITVKNGTDTVTTIAKGTDLGSIVGATAIAYAAVASGDDITVESDGGDCQVIIFGTEQSYA